jgi:biotin carboxylase
MRADDADQFVAAVERLKRLLDSIDPSPQAKPFLVERFIPGFEVALEGVLNGGRLKVLALFDKPDPLDGPFFEETIYVTPSRLPTETQAAIARCASDAARALGLREGPMHAELRVNAAGPWLVEVAGRSIGGLCSRTLRFGTNVSLEELILRQAFGLEIESLDRENQAGGVMMIPIPEAGLLKGVEGIADAECVPGVEEIQITAKVNYPIVPLPEGDSYLGFMFARGESPGEVEAALREAHRRLHFAIEPTIALLPA